MLVGDGCFGFTNPGFVLLVPSACRYFALTSRANDVNTVGTTVFLALYDNVSNYGYLLFVFPVIRVQPTGRLGTLVARRAFDVRKEFLEVGWNLIGNA